MGLPILDNTKTISTSNGIVPECIILYYIILYILYRLWHVFRYTNVIFSSGVYVNVYVTYWRFGVQPGRSWYPLASPVNSKSLTRKGSRSMHPDAHVTVGCVTLYSDPDLHALGTFCFLKVYWATSSVQLVWVANGFCVNLLCQRVYLFYCWYFIFISFNKVEKYDLLYVWLSYSM